MIPNDFKFVSSKNNDADQQPPELITKANEGKISKDKNVEDMLMAKYKYVQSLRKRI